jgi:signal transduction histidine kinase
MHLRRPPHTLRWAWFRGVRGRSTIAAVIVVLVGLGLAAATFLALLQRDLNATVQSSATARVGEVVAQIKQEGVESLAADSRSVTRGSQVVQVIDGAGRVVSASSSRAQLAPLTEVRAAPDQIRDVRASRLSLLDDDDPYLLVVAGVRSKDQTYRVIVATPISAQQQSVRTALSLLLVGSPILLLLVGVATWMLVGRALGPVERIRARVSEIGGSRVEERIPVPASGDEIARLAATMNQMLERLDTAQRTQRRFVADSSHELRSPLATLAASLEVATTDTTNRSWRELAPVMTAEVSRMGHLVEDLLLLAKVDEHSMRLHVEEVDLDDLVDAEARRLRAFPRLTVVPSVHPVRVMGDRARLGQAITNLADNAARHATSTVRLTLRERPDGASIVVEDDGPGVPAEQRDRVFERFVRLDASRGRSSGGSGLGLSIVREIVLAHGGTVRMVDRTDGGCRVELTLPEEPPAGAPLSTGQPPSGASR